MRSDFYITGGTLPADALCYVERQADRELLDALLDAQFCYVLDTRQVGKSSLIERAAQKLRQRGIAVAKIDLTTTGKEVTATQWYNGMLRQVADSLHNAGMPDFWDALRGFWRDNGELGPMQRWIEALRSVVLLNSDADLVIFVDEIESVRSFDFTDEFFAGIRACYNRRVDDPSFRRLRFCLVGSATPDELIHSVTSTPFNIGRGITLSDFTPYEAAILAAGLADSALLARILYWTNGHPYLTQRLCEEVMETASEAAGPLFPASESLHPTPHTLHPVSVDALCERLFFAPEARKSEKNLAFVAKRILDSPLDRAALLDLYGRVRRGGVINDEKDALQSTLRLSGVARARNGRLEVRNRIYERVFDGSWIRENMPDEEVRRQRATAWRVALSIGGVATAILSVMGFLIFSAVHAEKRANANALLAQRKTREANANAATAKQNADNATRSAHEAQRLAAERAAALTNAQEEKTRADQNAAEAKKQAIEAKNATAQARNAVHLTTAALNQAEKLQYDGDISLAQREIEAGNFPHAEQLLEATCHNSERAFEWYYLNDLCHTELRRFSGVSSTSQQEHSQKRISMSPTSKQCLVIENGKTLLVDTETGRTLHKIGTDAAYYVSFLPDGKRALIAAKQKAPSGTRVKGSEVASQTFLALFDTANGKLLTRFPEIEKFDNITVSQDGSVIAAVRDAAETKDTTSIARTWEVATGKTLTTFRMKKQSNISGINIKAFALSPDGHQIVISQEIDTPANPNKPNNSYYTSYVVTCWSVSNGQKLWQTKHENSIDSIMFAPDGRSILLSQEPITLLDAATGKPLPNWPQNGRAITFSHNGDMIAALDKNKILLYDLHTGKVRKELPFPKDEVRVSLSNTYAQLAFSLDDSQLVVGGVTGQIFVFDIAIGKERLRLRGHSSEVEEIAMSSDNQRILSVAETVRLWYATRPRMGHTYKTASPRDSAKLVSFIPTISSQNGDAEGVYLIVLSMGSEEHDAKRLRQLDRNLAVSPDGRWVASVEFANNKVHEGRLLHLRSRSGANHDRVLMGSWCPIGQLLQCSFTPDSRIVMAVSQDQQLRRWYVATGKPVASSLLDAVALSPDGRFAVFRRSANRQTGKHSPKANAPETPGYETRELATGRVWSFAADWGTYIALSRDGKWLAYTPYTQSNAVTILDGRTGHLVSRLVGHTSTVGHLVFSPDGRRIATTDNNTLCLWDTESGRILLKLPSNGYRRSSPAFSPDGQDLVQVGIAGGLMLLRKSPEQVMASENLSSIADDVLKPLAEAGDPAGTLAAAQRLLARDPTLKQKVAEQLNAAAWNVVDPDAKAKASPERIAAAIPAAEQAVALTGRHDAAILDTLATAYFVNGNAKRAVELEMEALKLPDIAAETRAALVKNLAHFKGSAPLGQ